MLRKDEFSSFGLSAKDWTAELEYLQLSFATFRKIHLADNQHSWILTTGFLLHKPNPMQYLRNVRNPHP